MKSKLTLVVAMATACAAVQLAAMPTEEETRKAEPVVKKLLAQERAALESGKKTRSEVAAAAMKLADEADTDAAKLLLMKGAFVLYVQGGNLEKAVETMKTLEAAISDMPPQSVTNMIEMALLGVPKKVDGARLYKLLDETKADIPSYSDLPSHVESKAIAASVKERSSVASILKSMIKLPGRDCWLSATEVTQGQWESVMGYNNSERKGVNLPVEMVSRDDCDVFLEMLNKTKEVQASQFEFSLPSYEEWVCAAAAGCVDRWNCWIKPGVGGDVHDTMWYKENSSNQIHAVATKAANAFGFYDMLGNVWEWTAELDGRGRGIRRGLSCYDEIRGMNYRWYTPRYNRWSGIGLRLAAHIRSGAVVGGVGMSGSSDEGAEQRQETVDGYTWSYCVKNGGAMIVTTNGRCAVSPSPKGGISIPSTLDGVKVTSIGNNAFRNCRGLTSVTIPSGVTSIGDHVFEGCSELKSVTIPYSVKNIGEWAFSSCSALKSVAIPPNVERIGGGAFIRCRGLTSVTIPAKVVSIGGVAFGYCSALRQINVDAGNQSFTSIDGVLYTKDQSVLLAFPNALTSVKIPQGVTNIGGWAFEGCNSLKSVTIPEGVTTIENNAFKECGGLESVVMPSGLKKIGWDAFVNCRSLKSVTIPDGVCDIGGRAFRGCGELASLTLPKGLTTIGDDAFWGCGKLTSLTLPQGLTKIGLNAFRGLDKLTTVTIPAEVTSIGGAPFSYCGGLTQINVEVGNQKYTSVDGVLYTKDMTELVMCPNGLKAVTIPESVTSIGLGAFIGCSKLTSVMLPSSVKSIGSWAFEGDNGLTSMTVPESVTKIDQWAFLKCGGLTSVTMLGERPEAPNNIFQGCGKIKSIHVPANAKSWEGMKDWHGIPLVFDAAESNVASSSMEDRSSVASILKGMIKVPGRDYWLSETELTQGQWESIMGYNLSNHRGANLPVENVSRDDCDVFLEKLNQTEEVKSSQFEFRLPELEEWKYAAWAGSAGHGSWIKPGIVGDVLDMAWVEANSSNQTHAVATKAPNAFGFYDMLGNVWEWLSRAGGDAPGGCGSLKGCAFTQVADKCTWNQNWHIPTTRRHNCVGLRLAANIKPQRGLLGRGLLRRRPLRPQEVAPQRETVDGYTWSYRVIDGEAMIASTNNQCAISPRPTGNVSIPSVLGGAKVTRIGSNAFNGCRELVSVTIPEGVTILGNGAFAYCAGLKSATIPSSVRNIDSGAFANCGNLQSIVIPEGVESIKSGAFSWYCGVETVSISSTVTNIEQGAFCDCTKLRSFHVDPANPCYRSINGLLCSKDGSYLVAGVNGDVMIPEGVATIGSDSFHGCFGLNSVLIPSSVTNIEHWALSFLPGLSSVRVDAANPAYKSVDGLLLTKDGRKLVRGVNGKVTIPDGVECIIDAAFSCSRVDSLAIPEGVTNIEHAAFYRCSGIQTVTIPSSVKNIGGDAFGRCYVLTSATMRGERPNAPKNIFERCGKLKSIHVPANAKSWAGMKEWFGIPLVFDGEQAAAKLLPESLSVGLEGALVGYWTFDGNANDATKNRNNGTLHGVTQVEDRYGKVNKAYRFNGSSYIEVPHAETLNMTHAITMTAWIKPHNWWNNVWTIIMQKGDKQNCNYQFAVDINANKVYLCGYDISPRCSQHGLELNKWQQVALTYESGKSLCFYRNGVQIGTWKYDKDLQPNNASLLIGYDPFVGPEYFIGDMDDVRLFNRALSEEEIKALYKAEVPTAGKEIVDGIEWTYSIKDGKAQLDYASSSNETGSITIPSTLGGCPVTSIRGRQYGQPGVFGKCSKLTSVTIPSSVMSIGDRAFERCTNLTNVTISSSVTRIGSFAFFGCSSLVSIVIPSGVTSIGCRAFDFCSGLASVRISASVKRIEREAFNSCSNLMSFSVESDNPSYSSRNGLLCSKDGSTLVAGVNGDVSIPSCVTRIGENAFEGCDGLTSVTIPLGVTSIGERAFAFCRGLTSVTIPSSVTKIGSDVFMGTPFYRNMPDGMVVLGGGVLCGYKGKCPSAVVIPSNVTSIAGEAFSERFLRRSGAGLQSVVIASSVTDIGSRAFSYCGDLANVTMLGERPNAPNNIFERCGNLKAIHVPANAKSWAGMKDWFGIPLVFGGESKAEDSWNSAQDVEYKFNYKLDDKGNAILTGVSPKPEGALVCPNIIEGHKVTGIGRGAFNGCDKMTKIMLPEHLETLPVWVSGWCIHGSIFYGCSALSSIGISETNPKFASVDGALYSKDKKVLFAYPKDRTEIKVCRETTSIQGDAFHSSLLFKKINIPEGISYTGGFAFSACPNLEEVIFPKEFGSINHHAFFGCPKMKKVVFLGDAPEAYWRRTASRENVFYGAARDIVVCVRKGSKGWNGKDSTDLPGRWPLDGSDSRPIRYIDEAAEKMNDAFSLNIAPGSITELDLGNVPPLQFVYCPAGKFSMGYKDQPALSKVKDVEITSPFWVSKTVIRADQLESLGINFATNSITNGEKSPGSTPPVRDAWINDASIVVQKLPSVLKERFGKMLPPGYVFRLPTEAEFEYLQKAETNDKDVPTNIWGVERLYSGGYIGLLDRAPAYGRGVDVVNRRNRAVMTDLVKVNYENQPDKDPVGWSDDPNWSVFRRGLARNCGGGKLITSQGGRFLYGFYLVVAPDVDKLNKFYWK